MMLPALVDGSEISSTEVRRRFYAGEDFADIVPAATIDVLSRHKSSDFSISFSERMQVMMASGRFGRQNARKEVYKINTELFHDWQSGCADIDLGDHKAFLEGAKLY